MKSLIVLFSISITLASCAGSEESTGSVSDTTSLPTEADASTSPDSEEIPDTYEEPEVGQTVEHECIVHEDCTPKVPCAKGFCINGGCIFNPNHEFCDDGNPCTFDSCDPEPSNNEVLSNGGCNVNKPAMPCEDDNACTDNLCDPQTGCYFPTKVEACDDANLCTDDYCNNDGNCEHVPVAVDDGDIKTLDGCTPDGGVYHHLIECSMDGAVGQCEDDDPCTNDWCDGGTCNHKPINCDDGIACTDQLCMGGECVYIDACTDQDECSEASCNLSTGSCEQFPKSFVPSNVCVSVSCTPGKGKTETEIPDCCQDATECADGDACTENYCNLTFNVCEQVEKNCDDNIACTVDYCSTNGNCYHTPVDSLCGDDAKPYCVVGDGVNAGCVECLHGGHCDDNDPCTIDECNYKDGYICSNKQMECPENQVCTISKWGDPYCDFPESWCTEKYQCYDDDECTDDDCVNNTCVHTVKDCTDSNLCTVDTCKPEYGCHHAYPDCDDDNACTDDFCDPQVGTCENVLQSDFCIPCDTADNKCEAQTICVENASISYSGACQYGRCHHDYINVCDGNICEDGYCSELDGKCHNTPKDCDDGSDCTDDYCDWNVGCVNEVSLDCNDYNPCTLDSCDPTEGCINEWDFSPVEEGGCAFGPTNICEDTGLFNCKQCFKLVVNDNDEQCDDGIDATIDTCEYTDGNDPFTPAVCAHKLESATSLSGLVNRGSKTIKVDIKTNFGEWIFNLNLEPGEYAGIGSQSFQIHNAKFENGEDIADPISLACVTHEGWEYQWSTEYDGGYPTCLYYYDKGPSKHPMAP